MLINTNKSKKMLGVWNDNFFLSFEKFLKNFDCPFINFFNDFFPSFRDFCNNFFLPFMKSIDGVDLIFALSSYHCQNHICIVLREGCQVDWACTVAQASWLSHDDLFGSDILFRVFSPKATFCLTDCLIASDEVKPIKTLWKRSYRLHSFLVDCDLDTTRLGTASLSRAPWRPLTDTNQQRRVLYRRKRKKRICDTPKITNPIKESSKETRIPQKQQDQKVKNHKHQYSKQQLQGRRRSKREKPRIL